MISVVETTAVLACVAALSLILARVPFRIWVYLLLVCVPFDLGFSTGYLSKLSVVDYFAAAGLIALGIRFKQGLIRKVLDVFGFPLLLAWFLFFIYGVLTTLALGGSFKGILRWGESLFGYFIGVLAVRENDRGFSASIAALLSALGSLMAVWALVQFCQSKGDYTKTYAIFKQHNGLSAFLSLCLPASWALYHGTSAKMGRTISGLPALLVSLAFLAAYSRGAWLGIFCATVTVGLLRYWGRPKTLAWSAGLGFLFVTASAAIPVAWALSHHSVEQPFVRYVTPLAIYDSNQGRLLWSSARTTYWQAAGTVFRAHPWVGLGPKNYERKISTYLSPREHEHWLVEMTFLHRNEFWQHLHSMYLQILVEYGGIGLVLWAIAMARLVAPMLMPSSGTFRVYRTAFQISGIAFLVHNTVDILFVNSFDLVFMVLAALVQ